MFAKRATQALQTSHVYTQSRRNIFRSIPVHGNAQPKNYYNYDVNDPGSADFNAMHVRAIQYVTPVAIVWMFGSSVRSSETFYAPSDWSVWQKLEQEQKAKEAKAQL